MGTNRDVEEQTAHIPKPTETMRALVFRGPNQIALERVPIPKPDVGKAVKDYGAAIGVLGLSA